jgi:hypothetical protein
MKKEGFLRNEFIIASVMGIITLIEILKFDWFQKIFDLVSLPSAWFVGLSLGFAFSSLFQNLLFSLFSKRFNKNEEKENFFVGFVVTLIITSLITPYIKDIATYFFTDFFIYFHIILMQSIIILYLFFKLKNNYEVSGKYFISNEIIILVYTSLILSFVA